MTALPVILRKLYARKGAPLVIVMPPAVAFPMSVIDDLPDDVPMTILTMHMPRAYAPRPNIEWVSAFYSHAEREMAKAGNVTQIDANFSDIAAHYLRANPDLLITQATWPDKYNTRSIGPNADYTLDLIDAGVPVYVIENTNMPRVNGNEFSASIEVGYESTSEPLYTVQGRTATPADHVMAARIAPLIPDGATVQLGVGGLARSIVERIEVGAVWTEAIGDWVMTLPAGTPITATIAFGSPELYRWMDGNPDVTMRPASVTNDRDEMRARKVYSVNQAMMIDTNGSTSLTPGYSGKGGGGETTYNAYCSFVAAPDTRKGRCNIGFAGYPLHDVTQRPRYLVTTQGIVDTWPHEGFMATQGEIAEAVIDTLVAPPHRYELRARHNDKRLAA